MHKFKTGDKVVLTSGNYFQQRGSKTEKTGTITAMGQNVVIVTSKKGYEKVYHINNLKLYKKPRKKIKQEKENKKILKEFSKKKPNTLTNYITIYCIKNYNFTKK